MKDALQQFVNELPEVSMESWNEDLYNERTKAFKTKGHFAARMTPFCGVFRDGVAISGFYSEDNSCQLEKIKQYLIEKSKTENEMKV